MVFKNIECLNFYRFNNFAPDGKNNGDRLWKQKSWDSSNRPNANDSNWIDNSAFQRYFGFPKRLF
jgi:hypothetical protein